MTAVEDPAAAAGESGGRLENNRFAQGTFNPRPGAMGPSPVRWLPTPLWRALSDRGYAVGIWLVRGSLPPALRERMGLEWTERDRRRMRRVRRVDQHAGAAAPGAAAGAPGGGGLPPRGSLALASPTGRVTGARQVASRVTRARLRDP